MLEAGSPNWPVDFLCDWISVAAASYLAHEISEGTCERVMKMCTVFVRLQLLYPSDWKTSSLI